MKVKDIPKPQLHLLASLLHHPPSLSFAEHASKVYCIEPQLDRPLLRPDLFQRIIQLQPSQSHYTTLCSLHKILNAKVVHELFLLLATEVGLRLNKLIVAGRDKIGHETWDRSILNLRALHGAWLDTEVFWDTFGGTLDIPHGNGGVDYMTKWMCKDNDEEERRCEACILTRIGSDLDTVFDLDMIVRSRIHTRSVKRFREPRLMKLIEGWLKAWELHYSVDRWWDKLEWNRLRASRLKDARREVRREERRGKDGDNDGGIARTESRRNQKVTTPIIKHEQQRARHDKSSAHRQSLPNTSSRDKPDSKSHSTAESVTHSISDDENDDDKDIRQTLYATENDIIDTYAALISTPFLPGMCATEHQNRASVLSKHCSTIPSPNPDAPSWPMVAKHATPPVLNRSQSARHAGRRARNYSESVYSQPSQPPAPTQAKTTIKRSHSHSTRAHRTSQSSWVTASIAPSLASTSASMSKTGAHKRPAKYDQKFDTINEAEEASLHRGSLDRRRAPVSPVDGGVGSDSPVSPVSPMVAVGGKIAEMGRVKSRFKEDLSALEDNMCGQKASERDLGDRKVGSRLSRPFEAPATGIEPRVGTVLDSVRRLRQSSPPRRTRSHRDSIKSDVARWVEGQKK